MRPLFLLALSIGFVGSSVMFPAPARAYVGPWCAIINYGGGVVSENCAMASFEQCRNEAQRFGPSSFCRQNGYWPGYWSKSGEPKPAHRARKSHRRHS